jgi:hypothetical protein
VQAKVKPATQHLRTVSPELGSRSSSNSKLKYHPSAFNEVACERTVCKVGSEAVTDRPMARLSKIVIDGYRSVGHAELVLPDEEPLVLIGEKYGVIANPEGENVL